MKTQPTVWPEMVSSKLGKYLCSYHHVESSRTCNSGDVFKPLDIDVECLDLMPKWNMDHGGYEVSFGKKDFESQLNQEFVDCGLHNSIINNVTVLQYVNGLEWVEFQFTGGDGQFGKNVNFCSDISLWHIVAEPGQTYYHRRTQVKFQNKGSKCKLLFNLVGCISTNGNLIIIESVDNEHIIEYWCGANATGNAHITLDKHKVITIQLQVLKNYLPHKNTVRNSLESVARLTEAQSVHDVISNIFGVVDYGVVFKPLGDIWHFFITTSWWQIIFEIVLFLTAYNCLVRGNVLTAVLLTLFGLVVMFPM